MFTGITHALGIVQYVKPTKTGRRLSIKLPRSSSRLKLGSSVAVNGVCLTVVQKQGRNISFDVVPETLRKTNLGALKPDDTVNIEPSLRIGDELGGHLVLGHVDGVGTIVDLTPPTPPLRKGRTNDYPLLAKEGQGEVSMRLLVPRVLISFIAPQGCIAIDGVSLTVVNVRRHTFTVALIPYTLTHTNLGQRKVGDKVNVEVDLIARYLQKLL